MPTENILARALFSLIGFLFLTGFYAQFCFRMSCGRWLMYYTRVLLFFSGWTYYTLILVTKMSGNSYTLR